MGEWDFEDEGSSGFDGGGSSRPGNKGPVTGGLHVPMTLVCLLAVSAAAFGMAWLMMDQVRSFWTMGLTFAVPFTALMFSALTVEAVSSKMTPSCSRRAQLLFAAGTVVAAFIVGGLAEALHQPVVITHAEPQFDYVIVEDKSSSMSGQLEADCEAAIHGLVDGMDDVNQVGFVTFGSDVLDEVPVRELDDYQRRRIKLAINRAPTGGTFFSETMDAVMRVVDGIKDSQRPIRIILVTDGDTVHHGNFGAFNTWAKERNADPKKQNVELSAIQIGGKPMLDIVKDAVRLTGGQIFDNTANSELAGHLVSLERTVKVEEPEDTLKATYEGQTADGKPNTSYAIITCVLLLLLGLLRGFSLMIMFSDQGQFRAQVVISALMGVAAFLLLNFGRLLSVSPAWICEGLAFSLFGLVFMKTNSPGGSKPAKAAQRQGNAPSGGDYSDDF